MDSQIVRLPAVGRLSRHRVAGKGVLGPRRHAAFVRHERFALINPAHARRRRTRIHLHIDNVQCTAGIVQLPQDLFPLVIGRMVGLLSEKTLFRSNQTKKRVSEKGLLCPPAPGATCSPPARLRPVSSPRSAFRRPPSARTRGSSGS